MIEPKPITRRAALQAAMATVAAGALPRWACAKGDPANDAKEHTLVTIEGKPAERGRRYGEKFKDDIARFLDREIYAAFIGKPAAKDDLLRYADRCAKAIAKFSPVVFEEIEGMATGSGLRLEDLVLLSLHEELYHKGAIPSADHCHVAAAGPPMTTGETFVGQTWDWMASVFGLSQMLLWKRDEGPDVLAYGYPGMCIGAGLNSAGIAHCWTSAFNDPARHNSPRVGIPSYALIAHLLYQDSLKAVEEEARRAEHAGWFTFVFADGEGNFLNVEGSPGGLAVERSRGQMVRHQYMSRAITKTPDDKTPPPQGACPFLLEQIAAQQGKIDAKTMQATLAHDRVAAGALDLMVFNTTKREAYVTRGPGSAAKWKRFGFEDVRKPNATKPDS